MSLFFLQLQRNPTLVGEGSNAGKTAIPQAPWAYGLKTQVGEFCKSVFSFSFQCLTFLFAQQARGTFALSNPWAGRPGLLARLTCTGVELGSGEGASLCWCCCGLDSKPKPCVS